MNLVLDYGNSFVKVGVFDNDELKQNLSFSDVGSTIPEGIGALELVGLLWKINFISFTNELLVATC